MTGIEHFVEHTTEPIDNLLEVAGLGPVKVVLILRCAVFRESMGSVRPNPNIAHTAAQLILHEWFLKNTFRLPSLKDLHSVEQEE